MSVNPNDSHTHSIENKNDIQLFRPLIIPTLSHSHQLLRPRITISKSNPQTISPTIPPTKTTSNCSFPQNNNFRKFPAKSSSPSSTPASFQKKAHRSNSKSHSIIYHSSNCFNETIGKYSLSAVHPIPRDNILNSRATQNTLMRPKIFTLNPINPETPTKLNKLTSIVHTTKQINEISKGQNNIHPFKHPPNNLHPIITKLEKNTYSNPSIYLKAEKSQKYEIDQAVETLTQFPLALNHIQSNNHSNNHNTLFTLFNDQKETNSIEYYGKLDKLDKPNLTEHKCTESVMHPPTNPLIVPTNESETEPAILTLSFSKDDENKTRLEEEQDYDFQYPNISNPNTQDINSDSVCPKICFSFPCDSSGEIPSSLLSSQTCQQTHKKSISQNSWG